MNWKLINRLGKGISTRQIAGYQEQEQRQILIGIHFIIFCQVVGTNISIFFPDNEADMYPNHSVLTRTHRGLKSFSTQYISIRIQAVKPEKYRHPF